MPFKDHFSTQAATYAAARPGYPPALFGWLATLPARPGRVWDAGCGNGQAAVALAEHFDAVVATDPSAAQIAHAQPHPRISYRVEPAEAPTLAAGSVDLATVAQAYHWFDHGRFIEAVRRVLRPDGAIAVWSYGISSVDAAVDTVFARLYEDLLGPYWPPERAHIENGYRDLPFPFAPLQPPEEFAMRQRWTLEAYLAYLRSWSATQRYRDARGEDPVARVEADMRAAWGEGEREVRWPLQLRAGRA